jgi:hypothetical protein
VRHAVGRAQPLLHRLADVQRLRRQPGGEEWREEKHIAEDRRRRGARGVPQDIPRVKNVKWLEPGYAITTADLEDALAAEHAVAGRVDILIVRPEVLP